MPKPASVDQHPQKDRIVKALIKGTPYREITERFGISKASLSRYLNDKLIVEAANVRAKTAEGQGRRVLDEIEETMTKVKRMLAAADDWLKDPRDPERYYLGPRSEEVEVVYIDDYTERGAPIVEIDTLYNLLEKALRNKEVLRVKFKHADPRKLLLDASSVLNRQLDLLARIEKLVGEKVVNLNIYYQQFQAVMVALQKVTMKHPELKKVIVKAMEAVDVGGG